MFRPSETKKQFPSFAIISSATCGLAVLICMCLGICTRRKREGPVPRTPSSVLFDIKCSSFVSHIINRHDKERHIIAYPHSTPPHNPQHTTSFFLLSYLQPPPPHSSLTRRRRRPRRRTPLPITSTPRAAASIPLVRRHLARVGGRVRGVVVHGRAAVGVVHGRRRGHVGLHVELLLLLAVRGGGPGGAVGRVEGLRVGVAGVDAGELGAGDEPLCGEG